MLLLLYKILPTPFPIILTTLTMIFIIHMVTTFSIFGRIILHSNAMSDVGVFSRSVEEGMLPVSLFQGLLDKTEGNRHVPVSLQYRRNLREALRKGEVREEDERRVKGWLGGLGAILRENCPSVRRRIENSHHPSNASLGNFRMRR